MATENTVFRGFLVNGRAFAKQDDVHLQRFARNKFGGSKPFTKLGSRHSFGTFSQGIAEEFDDEFGGCDLIWVNYVRDEMGLYSGVFETRVPLNDDGDVKTTKHEFSGMDGEKFNQLLVTVFARSIDKSVKKIASALEA